jgi:peptidoglycan/LPS O-acetylase OafA/YrhL
MKHIPVLDGIRGLAILLVLLRHASHHIDKGGSFIDSLFFTVTERGWVGVDLFFVLSGFLITGILCKAKGRAGYFKDFYARRVLRIFPAYYAVLVIFFVVLPMIPVLSWYVAGSSHDQIWFWTYLTNLRVAERGSFYPELIPNVLWSLAIEEQFYLAWPLVVYFCSRRTVLRICVSLLVLAVALRIGMVLSDFSETSVRIFTLTRIDGLAVGSLLAIVAQGGMAVAARRFRWIGLLAFVLLIWVMFGLDTIPREFQALAITLRFTTIALVFGALIAIVATAREGSLLNRFFSAWWLQQLGKYSYAIYLWHGPMYALVDSQLFDKNSGPLILDSAIPRWTAYVIVAGLASVLAALISWHLMEKHFLKLKRYFPSGAATPPSSKANDSSPSESAGPTSKHGSKEP